MSFIFEVFKFRKGITISLDVSLSQKVHDTFEETASVNSFFFTSSFAKKDDKGMFATLGPVLAEGQETVLIRFFVLC